MAEEELIIRHRLLTRSSTLGKSGLKKCAESVLSFIDALTDDTIDGTTCKQEVDAMLWELEQLEFEAHKTDILSFTCERELEAYEAMNSEIDASIGNVTAEIEQLKAKVQVEKTIRVYKEEYESISRVINELPSRKDLAAEIAIEEKRLNEAKSNLASVEDKLSLRTKQFALLMNTIQNLKATIDEDIAMDDEDDNKPTEHDEDDDMGSLTRTSSHEENEDN